MILKGGLNVRVLLFPDGEDPDSYSRKVGSTAFQKFLVDHTQDFVSFKAGLFASQAAGDPIKKAESIKEIVTSIAQIPDPVKRSVYIQETSTLLKIPEDVLIAELNKITILDRRKAEKDRINTQELSQLPVEAIKELNAVRLDAKSMIERQERETIRLLLNYADRTIEENTLSDFFNRELDDVEFSNPIYKNIFEHFITGIQKRTVPDTIYFLRHGSEEIKQVVTDLVTPRFGISVHWEEKFKIFIPKDEDLVDDLALTNVLRLKFWTVRNLVELNLKKIKKVEEESNWDELEEVILTQMGLKDAEKQLATVLGIVIAM
jgi:DNA primase